MFFSFLTICRLLDRLFPFLNFIFNLLERLFFLLGFFLDWIEITLIILPLIAPVVSTLGFNIDGYGVIDNPELVWFVVLIAVSLQTSFLTPPVGFAIFYLKGVCPPGVRLLDIYKGVVPFIVLAVGFPTLFNT